MAYDFCLVSLRGTLLPPHEMRRLVDALRQETELASLCEMTEHGRVLRGTSQRLPGYFGEGEFNREEYETFCKLRNLFPETGEAEADSSARMFIDYKLGQNIVSVKMPSPR